MQDGVTRGRLEPDVGARFMSLRRALGVTSFGIIQIVLQPGPRGRIHRQEEVYLDRQPSWVEERFNEAFAHAGQNAPPRRTETGSR